MLDGDIPPGCRGDQSVIIFERNEHLGFLALPESEDVEQVMNVLPGDAGIECVLNGVSAEVVGILHRHYQNAPREEMRESLLRWLADNGN